MKKLIILLVLPILLGMVPYTSYNFGPVGNEVLPMQTSVKPVRVVTGKDTGAGDFDKPYDFRFGHDGNIYIADMGNNQIVVLDDALNLINIIDSFEKDGQTHTFNAPEGVFAEYDGTVYIADTQNNRIVVLDKNGALVHLMDNVILTGSALVFRPQKVVVDLAGRVYVVSSGSTEGLIQLTPEGEFVRFFGSNRVRPNPIEVIYRMFLTRTQRQAREQFIPTEFSNIHVDEKGFLYVTTRNTRTGQVRRLNALGNDVFKHNGISEDIYGDLTRTSASWNRQQQFQAVTSDPDGNVYALDNTSGRVFTYNNEGQMLFMFGGRGNQTGLSIDAQAIAVRDGRIYLLDAGRGNITEYAFTEYGGKIIEANHLYNQGEYDASIGPWMDVLRMDAGNVLALRALGQLYYSRKEYGVAMEYYKLGKHREGYSQAFGHIRNEWIKENFAGIVFTVTGLLIVWVTAGSLLKRRRRQHVANG
jgi:sugar lactone lactonase YvrE